MKKLDDLIARAKKELDISTTAFDNLYRITKENCIPKTLAEKIVAEGRTDIAIPSADELLQPFYVREPLSEGIEDDEIPFLWNGFGQGMGTLYHARATELGLPVIFALPYASGKAEKILQRRYPHPSDFVLEYQQFAEWHHDSSASPLQRATMTFYIQLFMDILHRETALERLELEKLNLRPTEPVISLASARKEKARVEEALS